MADESALETKSVTFRIRMIRMPRITVTYKDKDDLFEAFKKKMAELGVSVDDVLWIDGERIPNQMNNADFVMQVAEFTHSQKLYVIDDADEEESSSSCCDEFDDHRRGCCCSTEHNPEGHPCPSDRSRGHRRLSERSPPRHHHHRHRHQNPVPACVPCACSLHCPTMGTGCGCGCSHGY